MIWVFIFNPVVHAGTNTVDSTSIDGCVRIGLAFIATTSMCVFERISLGHITLCALL